MNTPTEELRSRLERYSGFLAQDPDNAGLANEVAGTHLRLGHFAEAREVLKASLTRHPLDPALLSTLASVAMASGTPLEAIDILQGLIQSGHDHPVNRYNLAYALLYARRFAEARDVLLPVVDNPQVPEAPLLLARCLHHLGELDEAIRRLTDFAAHHPQHGEAQGVLALLHLDAMHSEQARAAAELAIKANPDDLPAQVTLGTLALETQDDKASTEYFEHALKRHPQSGRAWSGLALATMLKLDLPKAIEQLKTAVQHMPGHIGTWHSLAWCQLLTDDLEGAKQSFEQSMEIDRSFGESHGGLAVVAVLQGRLDDAEQSIKRALRLDSNSFAGRFAQSLILNKTDPAKAQALLKQMLSNPVVAGGESLQTILQRAIRQRQTGRNAPPHGPTRH